jgi:hypothetical protein
MVSISDKDRLLSAQPDQRRCQRERVGPTILSCTLGIFQRPCSQRTLRWKGTQLRRFQPTRPMNRWQSEFHEPCGVHPYLLAPRCQSGARRLSDRCRSRRGMRTGITQISLICVVVCRSQLISSSAPNGGSARLPTCGCHPAPRSYADGRCADSRPAVLWPGGR